MIAIAPVRPRNIHGLELLLNHDASGSHIDRQIQELNDRISKLESEGARDGWIESYPQHNNKRYYYLVWSNGGKRKRKYIPINAAADVEAETERGAMVRRLKGAIVRLEEWRAEYADLLT